MTSNTRIPPHDIAAEEALIGSLLIDGSMLQEISLSPTDFYHEPHKILFEVCLALNDRGSSINQITVSQELNTQGKLEQCGGVAYLSHLISIVPSPLDAPDYANIIRDLSTRRALIELGQKIIESGFTPGEVNQKLESSDKALVNLRTQCGTTDLITPKDRATMMFERYHEMADSDESLAIHTGLIDLDKQLGDGLHNGEFYVLGARPKMGKTTLMMQIANYIAQSKPVLVASAEMPVESITDRDVAQVVGSPINLIRSGKWTSEIESKIMNALGDIAERNVYFLKPPRITTARILQAALSMQARYGLGAVFIDYMGILSDDLNLRPYERLTTISRRINEMKLTLNVPIFAAHQLSRDLEQQDRKSNRRPKLSDLRDSGAIEQDADVVIFIYRDNYYDLECSDNTTEIIIAANRQGVTGKLKFYYDAKHQQYRNLAEAQEMF